jgi:hypothetical protein
MKILENLKLPELLRFGFSGVIFIGAFVASRYGIRALLSGYFPFGGFPELLLVASLLGCLIYSIHRVIYYHCILPHWVFQNLPELDAPEYSSKKYFELEFDRDCARWRRKDKLPGVQEGLAGWGDQVHFLYCSAWASLVGAVTGRLLLSAASANGFRCGFCSFVTAPVALWSFWCIILLSVVCGFAALFQNRVLTRYDIKFMQYSLCTAHICRGAKRESPSARARGNAMKTQFPGANYVLVDGGPWGQCSHVEGRDSKICNEIKDWINKR